MSDGLLYDPQSVDGVIGDVGGAAMMSIFSVMTGRPLAIFAVENLRAIEQHHREGVYWSSCTLYNRRIP